MLVTLKEILQIAEEKNIAVGSFNTPNLTSLTAILSAAEELDLPVIIQFAQCHEPWIPLSVIGPVMIQEAKKANVPVCVHLDHGSSMESCIQAIRLGFTSVMLDASAEDYETNVRETKEIVRLAHSVGVTVEAELGHIFSSDMGLAESPKEAETLESFDSAENVYTDPATAKDFVERTGVDVLAIAFGTTHGIYTKKPKLDLERITKIKEAIDIPFVMHGGSGLSKEEFQTAIRNGIRKINYYTYMTLAGGRAVKEALDQKSPDENVFFHDIPMIAVEAMKENVKEAIQVFGMEV